MQAILYSLAVVAVGREKDMYDVVCLGRGDSASYGDVVGDVVMWSCIALRTDGSDARKCPARDSKVVLLR